MHVSGPDLRDHTFLALGPAVLLLSRLAAGRGVRLRLSLRVGALSRLSRASCFASSLQVTEARRGNRSSSTSYRECNPCPTPRTFRRDWDLRGERSLHGVFAGV